MDPTKGPVSQVFGANPQFAWQLGYGHLGIDYAVPIGTSCYAIADGVVLFADWGHKLPRDLCNRLQYIFGSTASGIQLLIQHDGWVSSYNHGSATHLNPGDRVKRGDDVFKSGTTGNSTGPHLHFEVINTTFGPASASPPFSRYNPVAQIQLEDKVAAAIQVIPVGTTAAPAKHRYAGPNGAKWRKEPKALAPLVREIPKGQLEVFTHWGRGDYIDGGNVKNDIWFKDDGGWGWSGNFTSQHTTDLPQWEAPLAANQRKVGPSGTSVRSTPFVKPDNVLRSVDGNTIEVFTHWTRGENVTLGGVTSDIWFGDNLGWSWSGGYTSRSTDGLAYKPYVEPAPEAPKPATPAPVPTPAPNPKYTFTKDLAFINEVHPAAEGNFERGNFPGVLGIDAVVIHEFNAEDPKVDPVTNRETVHLDSVINTFTGTGRVASAHIGVEGDRRVQFVSFNDRAYAQGPDGNGIAISIESYGGQDAKTRASVAQVIFRIEVLRGGKRVTLKRHLDIMPTKCGNNIDLDWYRKAVDALWEAELKPPAPESESAESFLAKIRDQINEWFKGRK